MTGGISRRQLLSNISGGTIGIAIGSGVSLASHECQPLNASDEDLRTVADYVEEELGWSEVATEIRVNIIDREGEFNTIYYEQGTTWARFEGGNTSISVEAYRAIWGYAAGDNSREPLPEDDLCFRHKDDTYLQEVPDQCNVTYNDVTELAESKGHNVATEFEYLIQNGDLIVYFANGDRIGSIPNSCSSNTTQSSTESPTEDRQNTPLEPGERYDWDSVRGCLTPEQRANLVNELPESLQSYSFALEREGEVYDMNVFKMNTEKIISSYDDLDNLRCNVARTASSKQSTMRNQKKESSPGSESILEQIKTHYAFLGLVTTVAVSTGSAAYYYFVRDQD